MAGLPKLMQKLLANSGVGPLLRLDIMPTELQRRTSDTGSIVLPTGTTAQRDASASKGALRFNSTTGHVEVFNGSAWVQVVTSSDGRGVPLGTCSMHMCRISSGAAVAPEGYLICDGSQINHSDYPDLVELLWQFTAFAGNGSSYAVLPNLNHRFLEGATSVAEIGTLVEAGLPDITGYADGIMVGESNSCGGAIRFSESGTAGYGPAYGATVRLNYDAAWSNGIYSASQTVQPSGLRLMPCIKS